MSESINFDIKQLAAINTTNKNILISAGAGSGKTEVLSEKVKKILTDKQNKIQPRNILVLTFTRFASKSMKDKIIDKINSNPNIDQEIADKIKTAHIQNFDSFSLYIFKKYSYLLNLNSNISIINDVDLNINLQQIIDNITNNYLEKHDEEFIKYFLNYSFKNTYAFNDMLLNIYQIINKSIKKDFLLNSNIDEFYSIEKIKNDYDAFINYFYDKIQQKYYICFKDEENLFESDDFSYLEKKLKPLIFSKHWRSKNIKEYLEPIKIPKINKNINSEHFIFKKTEFTNYFNDNLKKIYLKNSLNYDSNLILVEEEKQNLKFFLKLIKEIDDKIFDYKKMINKYTFDDIARITLNLLDFDVVKQDLKRTYKFILVDEYQDTSDIQEEFINKFSNNNVYCVGDVKQSIYGFRNANCDIFNDKYNQYANNNLLGEKIDLTKNFRSRKEILETVNNIFSILFSKNNVINYKRDHLIEYGFSNYENFYVKDSNYGINLYDISKSISDQIIENKKYNKKEESIAFIIVQDIINKINNGFQIYDKSKKCLRNAKFFDFAIISSKRKYFDIIKKIFSDSKVPILNRDEKDFISKRPITVIKSITNLIYLMITNEENENLIKKYYLSICRSFLVDYTDDYLYYQIFNNKYKEDEVYKKCLKIANDYILNNYTLDKLFLIIVDEFSLINSLSKTSDIKNNIESVQYFYNLFVEFQGNGKTLEELINMFDFIESNEDKAKLGIENTLVIENSVNLMTIHQSKGLEFPIVYLVDCEERKNSNSNKYYQYSKKYGLNIYLNKKEEDYSFYKILQSYYIKSQDEEEKIRLFYVALTRAREQLNIITYNLIKDDGTQSNNSPLFKNFILDTKDCYNKIDLNDILFEKETNILKDLYLNAKRKENKILDIQFKKFNKIINNETKKASKTLIISDDTDLNKIDFGTKLHRYLQLIDFKNINLDFISDQNEKHIISKLLNNIIFKNINDYKIYKEYEFYDNKNDVHGFIDLLLIGNDIKIIDYKLKNIDDLEYLKQLNIYKAYIESVFKKEAKCYLLSIIDNELKEII